MEGLSFSFARGAQGERLRCEADFLRQAALLRGEGIAAIGRQAAHKVGSITISNLILDKFKYYGAFDKYKEILYNRKVDLTYLRFSNIKPEFKKEFFDKLQEDSVDRKSVV